ncbi:hypothetical protein ACI3KT_11825 [Microbacterium sp. ZW T6_19]|uniref:hypothetical protein n=1 Tax=Microbacterium sp. ZW T6_19 TaxID=3378082 RepID=UPI003854C3A6
MRTRPLPQRKTLRTGWNLRPDTERVAAGALRQGDVVMESHDYPAVITRLSHPRHLIDIYARYVWQRPDEPSWLLGTFSARRLFDRAIPGEY